MAELRNVQYQTGAGARTHDASIDEGLRTYMMRVYNYMALGIAMTTVVTLGVAQIPGVLSALSSLSIVFFIGIIAFSWFGPRMVLNAKSETMAHAAYWAYAVLWGLAIAPMVVAYLNVAPGLVAQAFAITAALFGSMSLLGYTTKRNLTGIGQFAVMAMIGLIIAMVVTVVMSLFGAAISPWVSFGFSAIYVVLISAITAWETQEIKQMYVASDGQAVETRKSIFGAFLLYGSFISMFIHILNLLGFMNQD
ncbi:MAG: Bax inhibitor-1/YccA family protein [Roseitalea sp.]|jgi:FtsH-binding integral membrane protein|nr:Bax inhibitor-1/YccA family protein [Roseitalea sp.]MBO6721569.1 Bax inhibitor-1/YccA family protein [Roseitalea sp.]MBO6743325.1 Bax inhibitor-1/YccA family protein [Roseitalea sp.]